MTRVYLFLSFHPSFSVFSLEFLGRHHIFICVFLRPVWLNHVHSVVWKISPPCTSWMSILLVTVETNNVTSGTTDADPHGHSRVNVIFHTHTAKLSRLVVWKSLLYDYLLIISDVERRKVHGKAQMVLHWLAVSSQLASLFVYLYEYSILDCLRTLPNATPEFPGALRNLSQNKWSPLTTALLYCLQRKNVTLVYARFKFKCKPLCTYRFSWLSWESHRSAGARKTLQHKRKWQ